MRQEDVTPLQDGAVGFAEPFGIPAEGPSGQVGYSRGAVEADSADLHRVVAQVHQFAFRPVSARQELLQDLRRAVTRRQLPEEEVMVAADEDNLPVRQPAGPRVEIQREPGYALCEVVLKIQRDDVSADAEHVASRKVLRKESVQVADGGYLHDWVILSGFDALLSIRNTYSQIYGIPSDFQRYDCLLCQSHQPRDVSFRSFQSRHQAFLNRTLRASSRE